MSKRHGNEVICIDVSEKGYLGGYRGDNNARTGFTIGNTTTGGSFRLSAASYGGLGGQYTSYNVNVPYGSLYNPNEFGSGGGGDRSDWFGGNGGGLVRITSGEIILNGSIKTNGGDGANTYNNGGGSGGGIYIQTGILRGTGSITAHGGKSSVVFSGTTGGGGGRIAIYYNDILGFNTANIASYGGIGFDANGGAGTIYLKSSLQTYGDLIVDNNGIATTGFSTPLPSVGTGISTDLTADTLTDATQTWRAGDLLGIYLNPNINQNSLFKITSNDAATIFTDPANGDMTLLAAIGDTYSGKHILDNLFIRGSARVETGDDIQVLNPTDPVNNVFAIDGILKANSLDRGASLLSISNGGLIADTITGTINDLSLTNSTMETK